MVGHLLEYHPAVAKIKAMIDDGELGRVLYIYSNRLNLGKVRTEENILWSFGPHDVSISSPPRREPVEVVARGGTYLSPTSPTYRVRLSFPGGTIAHIFVSWLDPYKEPKLIVVGEKKMVVFDDMESRAQDHRLRQGRHHDAHQVRELR